MGVITGHIERQNIFSLPEGSVSLTISGQLTTETVEEVAAFFELVLRQLRRTAVKPSETFQTS